MCELSELILLVMCPPADPSSITGALVRGRSLEVDSDGAKYWRLSLAQTAPMVDKLV
jgi:hypothetical protein